MKNVFMCTLALLVVAVVAPAQTGDPTGAVLWTSGQIKDVGSSMVSKLDETKGANLQMLMKKTHNVLFFHREGSAYPEIHQKLADFMVVESGEGAIQVGGVLADQKPLAKDEIRGSTLTGGKKYPVKTGDILYIPANTPHRTLVEPGKQLNVMVIKVEP